MNDLKGINSVVGKILWGVGGGGLKFAIFFVFKRFKFGFQYCLGY